MVVLEDNRTIIVLENTTWNIGGTSIVMEYAMVVVTSIVYKIQALFRPARGGGIERQCTRLWAPFFMEQNCLKGLEKPNPVFILHLEVTTLQINMVIFFASSGFIFENLC